QVKDCLVYLRLVANPRDAVSMRRAINTPARGIGAKTQLALRQWWDTAQSVPRFNAPSCAECLMALLEDKGLDSLDQVLGNLPPSTGGARSVGINEEELGWSLAEQGEPETAGVSGEEGGGAEYLAWPDFSMGRVKEMKMALDAGEVEGPPKGQLKKLRVFAEILVRLRAAANSMTVPALLGLLLEVTDMETHVKESLPNGTDTKSEGTDRWGNVMELVRAAANPKFEGLAASGSLEAFLNEIALMTGGELEENGQGDAGQEGGGQQGEGGGGAPPQMIRLMTVHASKGLEFNTVFLTGLEDGSFPLEKAKEKEMDEERRLMYVGMTRAKARLFLTWRKERLLFGSKGAWTEESDPSPFLGDLPKGVVKFIRAEGVKPGGRGRG
ncbi:unnamed protein product, partial [Choristocarpus tenellus]